MKKPISKIGFGCYRVNELVEEHGLSLRKALLSGINVIDTSANYADGGSELLVGKVLEELISSSKIRRDEIMLVTKGGYIQGQNLKTAAERKSSGSPFSEVFEFSDKLWHCISPDFLEDQFERQFARLRTSYVDTYLLHNPEYSLSHRSGDDLSLDERRELFYGRIRKAFEFLEEKVRQGKIGSYGISSNTFVSYRESTEFVSLERCIAEAEKAGGDSHHFDSVQFPLNLFEGGAVTVRNNGNPPISVLDCARSANLTVYINRPLNAVTSAGLVRLADYNAEDFREKDFIRQMEVVKNLEEDLIKEILPAAGIETDRIKDLAKVFSTGRMIDENWKFFGSIEHFNDMLMQTYTPRITKISELSKELTDNEHAAEKLTGYIADCHRLMNFVSNYYKLRAVRRASYINKLTNEFLEAKYHSLPLSQKALLITSSASGVDSVLLGMRKQNYVEDALAVLKLGRIENAEQILTFVSSEVAGLAGK